MPDFTPEEVQADLAADDLRPVDDADIAEITLRINAVREALEALNLPGLSELEPVTIFGDEETRS